MYVHFFFQGDPDSTWFTAYVIKMFKQAMDSDAIPNSSSNLNIINTGLDYLKKNQGGDGSFPETGYIINPSPAESSNSKKLRLTSFIASVFLLNKATSPHFKDVIDKALTYIQENVDSADNYACAVSAYALSLGDKATVAESLIAQLKDNAERNSDGTKYWNLIKGTASNDHTRVIITAYGLLAHIKAKKEGDAEPYFKYLLAKKNPTGGYYGSFDTSIAYDAMGETLKGKPLNPPEFSVTYEIPDREKVVRLINSTNANIPQLVELAKIKNIKGAIVGIGTGSVQTAFEYFTSETIVTDDFPLQITPKLSAPGTPAEVDVCVTFKKAKYDNMIIVENQLTSGYVYDESSNLEGANQFVKVTSTGTPGGFKAQCF
jgi:A-macroglobulin TED domain